MTLAIAVASGDRFGIRNTSTSARIAPRITISPVQPRLQRPGARRTLRPIRIHAMSTMSWTPVAGRADAPVRAGGGWPKTAPVCTTMIRAITPRTPGISHDSAARMVTRPIRPGRLLLRTGGGGAGSRFCWPNCVPAYFSEYDWAWLSWVAGGTAVLGWLVVQPSEGRTPTFAQLPACEGVCVGSPTGDPQLGHHRAPTGSAALHA